MVAAVVMTCARYTDVRRSQRDLDKLQSDITHLVEWSAGIRASFSERTHNKCWAERTPHSLEKIGGVTNAKETPTYEQRTVSPVHLLMYTRGARTGRALTFL